MHRPGAPRSASPSGSIIHQTGLKSNRSIDRVRQEHGLNRVVVAMEPTGHYWKAIAYRMKRMGHGAECQSVSCSSVKELDDNSLTKHDAKDTGVITRW